MVFRYSNVCLLVALACSAPLGAADFPPGPMQEKVKAACTSCHAATQVTKQHKTKAEWSKVLDKMIGYGAEIPAKDREPMLKYLTSNFGPASPGKSSPKTAKVSPNAQ